MGSDPEGLTDKGKLLFGAGFVFGVMVTMLILAVVLVVVRSGRSLVATLGSPLIVTVVAGALFAAIIGTGLYYLAFPEHRTRIPVDPDQFDRPTEAGGGTDAADDPVEADATVGDREADAADADAE